MSARSTILVILFVILIAASACAAPQPATLPATEPPSGAGDGFVFGLILVGPQDDQGWSEAHYRAGQYVEEQIAGSRMLVMENLNPDAAPDKTLAGVVDEMVAQGAQLILITSDDFAADTTAAALSHPETAFVHISGDHALQSDAPPNVGNYYGRMMYGKMIAGCAAALATQTNHIGHVGPLINSETRRLANAAYLGARHCFAQYRGGDPADLRFSVEWIGFWFHIPGVTRDPAGVTGELIDRGADVIMSGIDTLEPLNVVATRAAGGATVWAVPYDYEGACASAPEVCLGVPYFNWRPGYLRLAEQVIAGEWEPAWEWEEPYWPNINDLQRSPVGFSRGSALTEEQSTWLAQFIQGLGNGSIVLFQGPLDYQSQPFLAAGEVATDDQLWTSPQLLDGMEGLSE
jgi:simple sugar transport system substrate-binding protein